MTKWQTALDGWLIFIGIGGAIIGTLDAVSRMNDDVIVNTAQSYQNATSIQQPVPLLSTNNTKLSSQVVNSTLQSALTGKTGRNVTNMS